MGNNIPPIAEKVKFWEEQDKINQAVIPRIIELNDNLKNIATELGEIDKKIAASESRVRKKIIDEISNPKSNRLLIFIAILLSLISVFISIFK